MITIVNYSDLSDTADTGMMNTILYGHELNEAAMLECVVYLELVRRGYRVSVGPYRSRGIDFTAWMEERPPEFYQVALRLDDWQTFDRELDSFRKMGSGYRNVLITLDCNQYNVSDDVELVNVITGCWIQSDVHMHSEDAINCPYFRNIRGQITNTPMKDSRIISCHLWGTQTIENCIFDDVYII